MPTLRVIVERMLSPLPGLGARYAEELTRELVRVAPEGCQVEAVTAAHTPQEIEGLRARLPGLERVNTLSLDEPALARAWRYGTPFLPRLEGMVHAPGLFAPLVKHSREAGEQTTVTVHDTTPWTHPGALGRPELARRRGLAKRARKYADAFIVPTHAVADDLDAALGVGDRVRVIAGAVGSGLVLPDDPEARADALDLPEDYLLAVGGDLRGGLGHLLAGLASSDAPEIPLVVAGAPTGGDATLEDVVRRLNLPEGRVRALGPLTDADLALVLEGARMLVHPALAEGFGLPLVEAFRFGTPVVHSDAPALVETSGGAGVAVERGEAAGASEHGTIGGGDPGHDPDGYAGRLVAAIADLLADPERADRLGVAGRDRERAFSWADSAERIWQLHADL